MSVIWYRFLHGTTLSGVLVAAFLLGYPPPAAFGQDSLDEEDGSMVSRTQMFQSLAEDVAELEKHSNVLKKVVKLVRPTVVHIEAEKTDQSSIRVGRRSQVEEAGSGFIIKLGSQFYVVTNRHVIKNAATRDIKIKLADGRVVNPLRDWGIATRWKSVILCWRWAAPLD